MPRRRRYSTLSAGPASRYGTGMRLGGTLGRPQRSLWPRIAGLVALAGLLGGLGWALTRPVTATVFASPADATVRIAKLASAQGTCTAPGIAPGSYTCVVSRAGFATRTVELRARRVVGGRATVALEALPQRLAVTVVPPDARVRVTRGGKLLASGTGTLSATITAGPISIEASAAGRNAYQRAFYLDRTSALEVFLDPEGQLVHQTGVLKTTGAPKGVAVTPDGKEAWATILDGPPSIEIFDLTQMRKSGEIDIGSYGAVEIEFSRDGKRAYASQMETAKVFEIDTSTRKVLRAFDTKSAWTKVVSLSPSQTTLYAANWSGNDVSRIDLKSGETVDRLPAPKTPRGLWLPSEKTVYVAGFDDGSLWKVDTASGGYKQLFRSGGALRHLVGDSARGVLFASDMGKDCVWITDLASGKTRRFARVGHKPNTIALSPDGRVLFVSNRGENNAKSYYLPGPEWGSILLLDARTARPLDAIVGGNQCTALAVSADGRTLVFSDFLDNRLRVYDVPPFDVLSKGAGGRAKTLAKDSWK